VISPPSADQGVVRRRCSGADVYFLANTGPETLEFSVAGPCAEWNPHTGQIGDDHTRLAVTLHPHAATVIVVSAGPAASEPPAPPAPVRWQSLDGPWQVTFPASAPQPVSLPHVWEEQPDRRLFSGAATYTSTFELDEAGPVRLDFGDSRPSLAEEELAERGGRSFRASVRGPVGETAEVRVNGVLCGTAWAPPYRVDLTAAVRAGRNDIEITVRNTAANALAADESILRLAADSEARYGLRFRMQDLDRALATVRSGLLSVPRLSLPGLGMST
jgi:hypothetical protein